ncbi:MAG: rsmH [Deltaproteobacteria bacterium]|nr:rsmH [Deltaproteobacteria bacterium]
MAGGSHLSVLVAEVLNYLNCRPDRIYVDATVGSGGHARRILEQSAPTGKVIGLDCDAAAIARAKQNLASFGERFLPIQKNFRDLKEVLHSLSIPAVDGILADLGVSSEQLDDPARGISFRWEAPLDMRLDLEGPLTAQALIQRLSAEEMEKILREFGEERWAGRIAKAIARQRRVRPLRTTGDLVEVIQRAIPSYRTRIHPATRTFQALRLAVNEELVSLETFLRECPDLLKPGGRLGVISFHSLEDRIVKEHFRKWGKRGKGETPPFRILTPKPATPSSAEIQSNPRARSAKLRAIEKNYEPIERGEYGGVRF